MNDKFVYDLTKAREILKQKLKTLKADIAESQRVIDINYAPITKPLQEIVEKLDKRRKDENEKTLETSESWSDIFPEKSIHPIPGTSIIHRNTPQRRKHVSWFSPQTHSSPTKQLKRKYHEYEEVSSPPNVPVRPKTRLSTSLVPQTTAKLSDPKHYQSYTQATSFAQPTFLEDEYIGELLPETPKGEDTKNLEEEEEPDTSESMDLDKSMAHAISLLQRRPSKSIIANKSVNKTLLETSEVRESLKGHDPMIRPYLIGLMTDEADEFDEKYGIREEGGNLKIGNATVQFDGKHIIIGKFTYTATKGLLELLFKKKPGKFLYEDAKNYKFILKDTKAAHVNYDGEKRFAASKAYKYMNIVKPVIHGKNPNVWWTRTWKTGLGLQSKVPQRKTVVPYGKVEYKYWDNVNELCDRLKLLIASRDAGHTGHDNEILAIIEELKESQIIM